MAFSSCSCGRFFITYSNGTGKIFTHLYFHIYQFCRSLFILISSGKNNQLRNTGEEEKIVRHIQTLTALPSKTFCLGFVFLRPFSSGLIQIVVYFQSTFVDTMGPLLPSILGIFELLDPGSVLHRGRRGSLFPPLNIR